jgi:lipoprotein-releasing system ATP-binding protein
VAEDVLRMDNISKTYGAGTAAATEVLHQVCLRLAHGEFVALMGPSGSGKSTLLNIVGLLDRPSAGTLYIDGRDTGALGEAELTRLRGRSIGFVFQYHYLLTAFTALENVMMPALLARGSPDPAMRAHALDLLTQVGLAQWADHRASDMSGGQRQRVAIARALALDPPLVLADEPTGNLDTAAANAVFELMRKVSATRGTAFLLVTHNLALAQRCDRIVELIDGRIAA